MDENPIHRQLVLQRVRNRILEHLETIVEHHRKGTRFDLSELLNQWEDWVQRPVQPDTWIPPTYTEEEACCLARVDRAWESFCSARSRWIDDEWAAMNSPEWSALAAGASEALTVMQERGRLPEDHVVGMPDV